MFDAWGSLLDCRLYAYVSATASYWYSPVRLMVIRLRFLAFNLTSWGYQDCQYNKEDGSFGGMLTKLLFRTLPNQYPAGSAYAHFPFLVPNEAFQAHMTGLPNNNVKKYTWTRPPVPKGSVTVESYELVKEVVGQPSKYLSGYAGRVSLLTRGLVPDQKDETLVSILSLFFCMLV